MMDGKLKRFRDHIRPICLPTEDTTERPICPDNSRDTTIWRKIGKTSRTKTDFKMVGGCLTVAGWGNKYDAQRMETRERSISCSTDDSPLGPDKVA